MILDKNLRQSRNKLDIHAAAALKQFSILSVNTLVFMSGLVYIQGC